MRELRAFPVQIRRQASRSRSSAGVTFFWIAGTPSRGQRTTKPPNIGTLFKMSGVTAATVAGVKRKRDSSKAERREPKSKSRRKPSSEAQDDPQQEILRLESQIVESRKNYNNIATLLQLTKDDASENETLILAAVALCRVFTRLLSAGDMVKSKGMAQSELVIAAWLKERYREYGSVLSDQFLQSEYVPKQSVGLTLLMRLVKEESKQKDFGWKASPFPRTVESILLAKEENTREEFAEKYFNEYDDIRFHTFKLIKYDIPSFCIFTEP